MGVSRSSSVFDQRSEPRKARKRYAPLASLDQACFHELVEHVNDYLMWEPKIAADLFICHGKCNRSRLGLVAPHPLP